MARLLPRTNAVNASVAIGSGASLGPVTPPWPWNPWHCQQPCAIKAALPFSAEAASAALRSSAGAVRSIASPARIAQRIEPASIASFEHVLFSQNRFPLLRDMLQRGCVQTL